MSIRPVDSNTPRMRAPLAAPDSRGDAPAVEQRGGIGAMFEELRRRVSELVQRLIQGKLNTDGYEAKPTDATVPTLLGSPDAPSPQQAPQPVRPAVFAGFDAQKLASPLKLTADGQVKSAKYCYAQLAQKAGMPPHKTTFLAQGMSDEQATKAAKKAAEEWFLTNIKPGMEAAGFKVHWVKGDAACIGTRENPEGDVVDFIRGCGSSDIGYTAVQWLVQNAGGAGSFLNAGVDWGTSVIGDIMRRHADKMREGVTKEEREANMTFLRDRIIEEGRAQGLDLAWNQKRGNGPLSIDAIAWRHDGKTDVVDIGKAYDDVSRRLELQWLVVSGPAGYDLSPLKKS